LHVLRYLVLGRPLASEEELDQLLPKRFALPLFASDPLSSVAYATEEIMLVLVLAGTAALSRMIPIALAISALVAIVVTSYRQTVRAYPQGGGAFLVTRDNLGLAPAMVAAAALLTDYVLTVAVSVAAGVAAITSAYPAALEWRVVMAAGFIVLLSFANLRGVRETSRLFATPTYAFFTVVMLMLIVGFARCLGGACPQAETAEAAIAAEVSGLSLFLVLRAFASGSTALTGIEAIADGVPAFRAPKARNASTTLAIMAGMSITMFLGITVLARLFNVQATEATVDQVGSVISQVGRAAFSGGPLFYVLQFSTVGILILAANTAYQDFPRLSAILSKDRLMPRQMRNRGDRLVYSNGILVLSALAIILLIGFQAELTRLIQLYVVGVFTSFTLSQSSMVLRWWRSREEGWRRSMIVNGVGAATTGVVLAVVTWVKFTRGAWLVVIGVPLIVALMWRIRAHYLWVADQLRVQEPRPPIEKLIRAYVLVSRTWPATHRAIQYAKLLNPVEIKCVHVEESRNDEFGLSWRSLYPEYPLTVITPRKGRGLLRPLRAYLRDERVNHPTGFMTVVVPELARSLHWWTWVAHRRGFLLKAGLVFERGLTVTDLVYVPDSLRHEDEPLMANVRTRIAVVPIGDLTQPSLRAVSYAQTTMPTELHVIHADVDDKDTAALQRQWEQEMPEVSLEILPNPYRGTVRPVVNYVRSLRDEAGPGAIINIILPEFIVPTRLGQVLHNQTGLALKAALLLEPDIAVTSSPWHLLPTAEGYAVRQLGEN
jgi:amino acid transporter